MLRGQHCAIGHLERDGERIVGICIGIDHHGGQNGQGDRQ